MSILTRDDITRLSAPERLELISELWDSLDEAEIPLSSAQRQELEGRLNSFDNDRAQGVTWEQLKAELASRAP